MTINTKLINSNTDNLSDGYVLTWDEATNQYVPLPPPPGGAPTGPAGGDLGGSYPNPTVTDLTISSEVQGNILYFNGSNWVALANSDDGYVLTTHSTGADPTWEPGGSSTPEGSAGGDLGGTYPNPEVNDLTITSEEQGSILYNNGSNWVQLAPGTSGRFLRTDGTGADPVWAVNNPAGAAGGDLGGTYPNPEVNDLTIASEEQGSILYNNGSNWVHLAPGDVGQTLTTGGTAANPSWSDRDFTIIAQKSDLPTPAGGVITLPTGSYLFTASIDLGTDRIVTDGYALVLLQAQRGLSISSNNTSTTFSVGAGARVTAFNVAITNNATGSSVLVEAGGELIGFAATFACVGTGVTSVVADGTNSFVSCYNSNIYNSDGYSIGCTSTEGRIELDGCSLIGGHGGFIANGNLNELVMKNTQHRSNSPVINLQAGDIDTVQIHYVRAKDVQSGTCVKLGSGIKKTVDIYGFFAVGYDDGIDGSGSLPTESLTITNSYFDVTTPFVGFTESTSLVTIRGCTDASGKLSETGVSPIGSAGGDLTGSYPDPTIDAAAVTFSKIQDISTDTLLGRDTAASGSTEEIGVSGGLEFTGSGGIQRSALTGDVSASAGSNSITVNDLTITSEEQGSVLYFNGTNWVQLAPGSDGYVLTTHDTGADPTWSEAAGGGAPSGSAGGDLGGTYPNPEVNDLTITSEEQGSVLYNNGSNWVQLAPGTDGHVLTTHSTGANPTWASGGGFSDNIRWALARMNLGSKVTEGGYGVGLGTTTEAGEWSSITSSTLPQSIIATLEGVGMTIIPPSGFTHVTFIAYINEWNSITDTTTMDFELRGKNIDGYTSTSQDVSVANPNTVFSASGQNDVRDPYTFYDTIPIASIAMVGDLPWYGVFERTDANTDDVGITAIKFVFSNP